MITTTNIDYRAIGQISMANKRNDEYLSITNNSYNVIGVYG